MSKFPVYRKDVFSTLVVKFTDTSKGFVVHPGGTGYKRGSLHENWRNYDGPSWEPYDITRSNIASAKTPDQLELFESLTLSSGFYKESTITKVPNGYVMTSHSGHQLFIKENTKETL